MIDFKPLWISQASSKDSVHLVRSLSPHSDDADPSIDWRTVHIAVCGHRVETHQAASDDFREATKAWLGPDVRGHVVQISWEI